MERVRRQRGETVWSLDYLGRQAPVESERSDAARNRQKILRAAPTQLSNTDTRGEPEGSGGTPAPVPA